MGRPRGTYKHLELTGQVDLKPQRYSTYNSTNGVIPKDANILPPKGLTKSGKKLWKSLVPNLISMGVLSETDFPLLERLVFTYEEIVKIQEMIKEFDSNNTLSSEGYIKNRKMLSTMLNGTQSSFISLCSRFGIGPTERTKLPIVEEELKEAEDPLGVLLGE